MFTRFVELVPMTDAGAQQTSQALLSVVGRWGRPRAVRTDAGGNMTSALLSEVLNLLAVEHDLSIPHRSESNGMIERANGEVMRHLRNLICARRAARDWSRFLPLVQSMINSTLHSTMGVPPITLMTAAAVDPGQLLLAGIDNPPLTEQRLKPDVGAYLEDLRAAQGELIELATLNRDAYVREYLQANEARPPVTLTPGQLVVYQWPKNIPPNKFAPRWRGPSPVVGLVGTNRVRLTDLSTGHEFTVHLDTVRLCRPRLDLNPLDLAAMDQQEYVVHKIWRYRSAATLTPLTDDRRPSAMPKTSLEFLVEWDGYPGQDSWEPWSALRSLQAMREFAQRYPNLHLF